MTLESIYRTDFYLEVICSRFKKKLLNDDAKSTFHITLRLQHYAASAELAGPKGFCHKQAALTHSTGPIS